MKDTIHAGAVCSLFRTVATWKVPGRQPRNVMMQSLVKNIGCNHLHYIRFHGLEM
ncbi:MAG TPA: hypothetical protein IAC35_04465 [Candidatus Cryptobacteroides merdipullorum]|uniref:Uncharacterized protein n=1 Tax=Candidatus Cryptobacteroides merdipullorum TaxID=2840771 RepID=A0A9D1KHN8_9BACT|nr:hypothetical protein [Candidatus Cryptobacteroides merdipullorum]